MKYVEVDRGQTKREKTVAVIVLFLFSGMLIMISVFTTIKNKKFFETAVPTMGEITKIVTTGSGDHKKHSAYVSYEVDGQRYETKLNYYSSGMREGDSIEVWYQLENPGDIESKKGAKLGIWLGLCGVLFLILAIFLLKKRLTGEEERGGYDYEN